MLQRFFSVFILTILNLSAAVPASAQMDDAVTSRLERLEREIKTLESTVYRGTMPPAPAAEAEPVDGAQLEMRLVRIEETLQDLTGKIEALEFELKKTQNDLAEAKKTPPAAPAPVVPPLTATEPPTDLTPVATPADGDAAYTLDTPLPDVQLSSNAMDSYNQAFSLLKAGQFAQAQQAFERFLKNHPEDTLAGNAQYWLGETFYVRRMFKEAATTFVVGYQKYPDGAKAPDNLLKLALSLKELGQTAEACQSLEQLKTSFAKVPASIQRRAEDEAVALKCSQP